MRWAGHAARMEEGRSVFKILTGESTNYEIPYCEAFSTPQIFVPLGLPVKILKTLLPSSILDT